MGVRMIDLLDVTRDLEAQWLVEHAEKARGALKTARDDGVSPAGLAQMEEMLEFIRDEGIGLIRSSTLLNILRHKSRNESTGGVESDSD